MTLGHYFARNTENRDHFIEFTFWGLNNWRDEASANGHRVSILNSTGEKTSEQGDLYSGYAVRLGSQHNYQRGGSRPERHLRARL